MISSTGSTFVKSTRWSAPILQAISTRSDTASTPIILVAPTSRAPAAAQSPIGPCANTAIVSPTRTLPDSAPEIRVAIMSGHMSTCSSVRPSGIGGQVGYGIGTRKYSAWAPSMVFPNRHPPSGVKPSSSRHRPANDSYRDTLRYGHLGYGSGNHALTFLVAFNRRAKLLDDADRVVTDGESFGDRILAFQDVNVGATDGWSSLCGSERRAGRRRAGFSSSAILFGSTNTADFIVLTMD